MEIATRPEGQQTKRDMAAEEASRYLYLERILRTAEVLRGWRFGGIIEEIAHRVSEQMGRKFCDRTTKRDLLFLQKMGVVYNDRGIWKYRGDESMFERAIEPMRASFEKQVG